MQFPFRSPRVYVLGALAVLATLTGAPVKGDGQRPKQKPKAGAHKPVAKKKRPAPPEEESGEDPLAKDMLKVGSTAPAFELPEIGGGSISLAALLKANKVTLVNFWSYG